MSKPRHIWHILILDRSGSMNETADPGSEQTKASIATAGVESYVKEQRGTARKVTFSAWQFDSKSTDQIADQATTLAWTCFPRSGTPLLDAAGTVLSTAWEQYQAAKSKPDRVFVVIITDGKENCSAEWRKEGVGNLIAKCTGAGWDVVYIGADFDAFAEAGSIGVRANSTLATNTTNPGAYAASFSVTTNAVTRAAAGGQSVSYTGAERTAASGDGK